MESSSNHFHQYNSKTSFVTCLSGSSRDRRKQYRALCRKYPDARITRSSYTTPKVINGRRVHVEDANSPQTIISIELPKKEIE
jgi:hypothetical protein